MIRTHHTIFLSVCLGFLAGCGPDASGKDPSNNGSNNGTTTGSNNGSNNGTTAQTNNGEDVPELVGIGTTADFAQGASAWYSAWRDVDGLHLSDPSPFGTGDIGLSSSDGYAYVLDRTAGVVQVLALQNPGLEIGTIELGPGTNPHSAVSAGAMTYISLYDTGEVAVAQSIEGAWTADVRIELSEFDSDGNPEPASMIADEGYVLVVLQTLENFAGVASSQLVVIDAGTDELVTLNADQNRALDLGVTNCAAGIVALPGGGFAVGCIGAYGVNDGGIVAITSASPGSYVVGETLVTEEELGGDVLDFAMTGPDAGLAIVSLPDFTSKTVRFDADGVEEVGLSAEPGYAGLDVTAELIAIGDRSTGEVVFADAGGNEVQRLATQLPPAGFRLVQ